MKKKKRTDIGGFVADSIKPFILALIFTVVIFIVLHA